jgi:hypothetical protein
MKPFHSFDEAESWCRKQGAFCSILVWKPAGKWDVPFPGMETIYYDIPSRYDLTRWTYRTKTSGPLSLLTLWPA